MAYLHMHDGEEVVYDDICWYCQWEEDEITAMQHIETEG
jgi:hypothetical protein